MAALTNSIVELQVFDTAGTAVMTTFWTGQNFAAGQTLKFSYTWNSPSSLPAGTYSVDLGVFNSDWSKNYYWNGSAGSIKIATTQAPPIPTGLTAIAGVNSVRLAWAASTGATSYNVYRGTAAGSESTTPLATNIITTTYTDTSITAGTKYFYKIAAVNASGTSGASTEVSATPKGAPPAAPGGLTATPGHRDVVLQWTTVSGATSYNVYRGTAAGAESTSPIAAGIKNPSYSSSGLTNGTTYFFKVAAVNANGAGPLSAEVSATSAK
jgi:fibronectin type 3 domain-containing protein